MVELAARTLGGLRSGDRAPVPDARTEVSVTSDDSLIYLIGGYARGEGRRPATPRAMLVYELRQRRRKRSQAGGDALRTW